MNISSLEINLAGKTKLGWLTMMLEEMQEQPQLVAYFAVRRMLEFFEGRLSDLSAKTVADLFDGDQEILKRIRAGSELSTLKSVKF